MGLIGGGLNLYFGQPKKPPIVVASPAPLPWTELDAGRKRQIALPPLPLSGPDYLVEIQSALAEKPIGWAFRVNGAASFYIEKLSLRKQAGQQSVVAVHTLMQNGNESARAETAVNLGADYDSGKVRKIRFEASGNRFTTFVDDKKIDDWRDSRLTSGGSGIYQDETTNAPAKERFEVSSLGNGKDDAKNDQKSSSTKK